MADKPVTELGDRYPRTAEEMRALRSAGAIAARDLCAFLDRSPTPYHAVREVAARLSQAGFSEVSERDAWTLAPGDRRWVVRNDATLVAFVVGQESPASGGFRLIGAHTDSPNLRVKPNADLYRSGYHQLGVEVYGGVLLTTWLDRDLSLAGRVMVDRGGGKVEVRLCDLARPVARVPNLAIHLNRGVNTDGLVLNQQKHLVPVVGLGGDAALRREIGRALDDKPERILAWDLCLYDTARASLGGLGEEFVFSARLDNLASCHAATHALCVATAPSAATRAIVLYDHEECGSRSAAGAAGSVLRDVLGRIVEAHPDRQAQAWTRAMAASMLVSADMAHAVHPNYADQHDKEHAPALNRGLVIKSNSNQSYATDAFSAATFEAICAEVKYQPQRFVVRSDLPCGSTIGPITAAALGLRTVDVGGPMLSMHSCREQCGTLDVHLSIETYRLFLG
jgi:aspartyl aminopeptidase